MKFDSLYNLLIETIKFSELPESSKKFYGLWISPNGEMDIVKSAFGHAPKAKIIVIVTPYLKERFVHQQRLDHFVDIDKKLASLDPQIMSDFLYFSQNFVRVVHDYHKIYFSTDKMLTIKQRATLKDVGMLYDMMVLDNTGKELR